jgi:DNA-binding transcriptional MerR regulator
VTADGLMSIGLFSRASLLSVKTLRDYHDAEILVPANVDPATGYRAYHVSQLTDAAVIRRLRQLDLPLAQVREILRAGDPGITRKVLGEHAVTMQARLDEVTRIVADLQESVEHPTIQTPVHVRHEPPLRVLAVEGRVRHPDYPVFLGQAYAELDAELQRRGITQSGPSGALYPPEILDEESDIAAYVPVDIEDAPRIIPAATVAVAVHVGSYETIDDTYRQLGAWVALNAAPARDMVREVYLVSYDQTADPDAFRTEIFWPVLDP